MEKRNKFAKNFFSISLVMKNGKASFFGSLRRIVKIIINRFLYSISIVYWLSQCFNKSEKCSLNLCLWCFCYQNVEILTTKMMILCAFERARICVASSFEISEKILCISASSAAIECVFRSAHFIISQRRSNLYPYTDQHYVSSFSCDLFKESSLNFEF